MDMPDLGPEEAPEIDPHAFLDEGGELGALMRTFDWSSTTLGPISDWAQSLKTAVAILLRSPIPIVLLWGKDGVMIYNDAYSGFAGGRHPQLLGSAVREGWPEVAAFNDNVMRTGLAGGTLSYRDQELTLVRQGVPEPAWMNLDYSPVLDETGRPAGVFAIVVETTERVLAERRIVEERERLRSLFEQAPGFMHVLHGANHVFELVNSAYLRLVGHRRDLIGKTVREAFPELAGQGYLELLDGAYQTGEPFVGHAMSVKLQRAPDAPIEERFIDLVYQPIKDERGKTTGIFAEGADVTKRVLAERRQRLLIEELNHRVKNTLATVQSIAAQTFRLNGDESFQVDRARSTFDARLVALSNAHNVLTRSNWDGAALRDIVEEAISAHHGAATTPFEVAGPPVTLTSKMALSISMSLHELCTNALKYGALTTSTGTVSIPWTLQDSAEGLMLELEWRERGGPPVAPPARRGFGSRLIERQLSREFGGSAVLTFQPAGLVCKIKANLSHLQPAGQSPSPRLGMK